MSLWRKGRWGNRPSSQSPTALGFLKTTPPSKKLIMTDTNKECPQYPAKEGLTMPGDPAVVVGDRGHPSGEATREDPAAMPTQVAQESKPTGDNVEEGVDSADKDSAENKKQDRLAKLIAQKTANTANMTDTEREKYWNDIWDSVIKGTFDVKSLQKGFNFISKQIIAQELLNRGHIKDKAEIYPAARTQPKPSIRVKIIFRYQRRDEPLSFQHINYVKEKLTKLCFDEMRQPERKILLFEDYGFYQGHFAVIAATEETVSWTLAQEIPPLNGIKFISTKAQLSRKNKIIVKCQHDVKLKPHEVKRQLSLENPHLGVEGWILATKAFPQHSRALIFLVDEKATSFLERMRWKVHLDGEKVPVFPLQKKKSKQNKGGNTRSGGPVRKPDAPNTSKAKEEVEEEDEMVTEESTDKKNDVQGRSSINEVKKEGAKDGPNRKATESKKDTSSYKTNSFNPKNQNLKNQSNNASSGRGMWSRGGVSGAAPLRNQAQNKQQDSNTTSRDRAYARPQLWKTGPTPGRDSTSANWNSGPVWNNMGNSEEVLNVGSIHFRTGAMATRSFSEPQPEIRGLMSKNFGKPTDFFPPSRSEMGSSASEFFGKPKVHSDVQQGNKYGSPQIPDNYSSSPSRYKPSGPSVGGGSRFVSSQSEQSYPEYSSRLETFVRDRSPVRKVYDSELRPRFRDSSNGGVDPQPRYPEPGRPRGDFEGTQRSSTADDGGYNSRWMVAERKPSYGSYDNRSDNITPTQIRRPDPVENYDSSRYSMAAVSHSDERQSLRTDRREYVSSMPVETDYGTRREESGFVKDRENDFWRRNSIKPAEAYQDRSDRTSFGERRYQNPQEATNSPASQMWASDSRVQQAWDKGSSLAQPASYSEQYSSSFDSSTGRVATQDPWANSRSSWSDSRY